MLGIILTIVVIFWITGGIAYIIMALKVVYANYRKNTRKTSN